MLLCSAGAVAMGLLGFEKSILRQLAERTRKIVVCCLFDAVFVGAQLERLAKLALPEPPDDERLQRWAIQAAVEPGNQLRGHSGRWDGLMGERGEPRLPCRSLKACQGPDLRTAVLGSSAKRWQGRQGRLLGHH